MKGGVAVGNERREEVGLGWDVLRERKKKPTGSGTRVFHVKTTRLVRGYLVGGMLPCIGLVCLQD